jgi:hypothetical protein
MQEFKNWISIHQQLTIEEKVYLAVFKSPVDTFVETVFFYKGKFTLPGRSSVEFLTHWMELPALPPDK